MFQMDTAGVLQTNTNLGCTDMTFIPDNYSNWQTLPIHINSDPISVLFTQIPKSGKHVLHWTYLGSLLYKFMLLLQYINVIYTQITHALELLLFWTDKHWTNQPAGLKRPESVLAFLCTSRDKLKECFSSFITCFCRSSSNNFISAILFCLPQSNHLDILLFWQFFFFIISCWRFFFNKK